MDSSFQIIFDVLNSFFKHFAVGERLVLHSGNASAFVTPKILTPTATMGFCLKFRYIIYGHGAQDFHVSVLTSKESIHPIWMDKDSTSLEWKYADIPFISAGNFQVTYFNGDVLFPSQRSTKFAF